MRQEADDGRDVKELFVYWLRTETESDPSCIFNLRAENLLWKWYVCVQQSRVHVTYTQRDVTNFCIQVTLDQVSRIYTSHASLRFDDEITTVLSLRGLTCKSRFPSKRSLFIW